MGSAVLRAGTSKRRLMRGATLSLRRTGVSDPGYRLNRPRNSQFLDAEIAEPDAVAVIL